MTMPAGGKPAKGRQEIRAALDALQQSEMPGHEAGPLNAGLAADARLPIASFVGDSAARNFQQALLEAGVMSQLIRSRRGVQVAVEMADRERAVEALTRYRSEHPESADVSLRLRYDAAILCGIIGGGVGLTIVLGTGAETFTYLALAACIGIGTLSGLLMELVLNVSRSRRGVLLSMSSLLVLMTLIALCVYLSKVIRQIGI